MMTDADLAVTSLQTQVKLLERRVERLEERRARKRTCSTCRGRGVIPGFWLGTVKTCPACHGRTER